MLQQCYNKVFGLSRVHTCRAVPTPIFVCHCTFPHHYTLSGYICKTKLVILLHLHLLDILPARLILYFEVCTNILYQHLGLCASAVKRNTQIHTCPYMSVHCSMCPQRSTQIHTCASTYMCSLFIVVSSHHALPNINIQICKYTNIQK